MCIRSYASLCVRTVQAAHSGECQGKIISGKTEIPNRRCFCSAGDLRPVSMVVE
jgi:hypothetical protein